MTRKDFELIADTLHTCAFDGKLTWKQLPAVVAYFATAFEAVHPNFNFTKFANRAIHGKQTP